MPILRADQNIQNLKTLEMNPIPEVTRVTCLADAGAYDSQTLTFQAFASCTQGDYAVVYNTTGTKFAIWLDLNANGTAPSGAIYSATDVQIKCGIVTGDDTATKVRNKVLAAITLAGTLVDLTEASYSTASISFTSTKLGNVSVAVVKNANDSGAGSITKATLVGGVASSLQNKYFIMRNPASTVFNAWFNVSSEGTDPNPAGTEIECAITAGGTSEEVAQEIATAINANSNFKAWVQSGYLYIANEATGVASDITAGDSGFTITKIQDGKAGWFYPTMSPATLSNTPSTIS